KLNIRLQPFESMLIVLEETDRGVQREQIYPDENSGVSLGENWHLDFHPVRDENFSITTDRLFEYGNHEDRRISTFAGRVSYQTTFELKETGWAFLDLGIEKHVTEVKLNGEKLGVKWWGRHLYHIAPGILKDGENQLEIIYTTILANYANSLTGNEVARRWIKLEEPDPMGLTGEVRLLKSM
ncbi:MAG: glycosylhydrolase-like jelly roll fold domain-containing protein, partial [Bacteroidales bacterium]